MLFRLLILVPLLAALAHAQDQSPVEPRSLPAPDQVVEPVTPSVRKIDGTRFQIGEVVFDQKSREIRFPARINMVEGLLEFLIVHEKGKVHESLLATTVSPTHLNLAFTLLRYSPPKNSIFCPTKTARCSTEFPDVPADVKAAARVRIDVEWNDGGKTRRVPANEWIQHAVKTTAMPAGPWVYGGSGFSKASSARKSSGDIVAIFCRWPHSSTTPARTTTATNRLGNPMRYESIRRKSASRSPAATPGSRPSRNPTATGTTAGCPPSPRSPSTPPCAIRISTARPRFPNSSKRASPGCSPSRRRTAASTTAASRFTTPPPPSPP
jgi:hypothetical protein